MSKPDNVSTLFPLFGLTIFIGINNLNFLFLASQNDKFNVSSSLWAWTKLCSQNFDSLFFFLFYSEGSSVNKSSSGDSDKVIFFPFDKKR